MIGGGGLVVLALVAYLARAPAVAPRHLWAALCDAMDSGDLTVGAVLLLMAGYAGVILGV